VIETVKHKYITNIRMNTSHKLTLTQELKLKVKSLILVLWTRLTLQSLEYRLMTLHSLISRASQLKKSVLMQEQELISSIW